MRRSIDPQLSGFLVAGVTAAGVAVFLLRTADRWYTPGLQLIGLLAAIACLWFGLQWSFSRLSDVYGD